MAQNKLQVQVKLLKAGIISIINKLYCLILKTIDNMPQGMEMKIQILKLVISYLSRDAPNLENKLECVSKDEIILMLRHEISPSLLSQYGELSEEAKEYTKQITHIPSTIPLLKASEYDETELGAVQYNFEMIKEHRGLLKTIVNSFIKTYEEGGVAHMVTNLRYWQASSIESFVRGCNPFLQLFVARSGIFPVLINDILNIQTHDDANLQTAFDILGETIKFNKRTILIFESNIRPEDLEKIQKKCLSHLIDSNVFIRSILLTLYKHTKEIDSDKRSLDELFDCPFMENSSM